VNPTGDFRLFVDGDESFFVREGPVRRDASEGRDENQETIKLDVVPRQNLKLRGIGIHDEQHPNEKAGDKDAEFVALSEVLAKP
jgi:hypothetical protein